MKQISVVLLGLVCGSGCAQFEKMLAWPVHRATETGEPDPNQTTLGAVIGEAISGTVSTIGEVVDTPMGGTAAALLGLAGLLKGQQKVSARRARKKAGVAEKTA
jgi:hypothetical protein